MAVSLRREQVIAGLLVCGVVVALGYASGFGLAGRVGPTDQAGGPPPGEAAGPPDLPLLPQAVAPPAMSVTGGAVPVVTDQPAPAQGTPVEPDPPLPGTPAIPAPPVTPSTAPLPPTPPTCVVGAAQTAADTVNSVVAGLPVGSLLGAGQVPQGTPAGLDGLLYTVTGYCPTTGASAGPVTLPDTALPVSLPPLPLVPAGG